MKKLIILVSCALLCGCAGLTNVVHTAKKDINQLANDVGGIASSVGQIANTTANVAGDVVKGAAIVATNTAETPAPTSNVTP